MSFIPPHTTTLIFDIEDNQLLIGYSGDFHPTYFIPLLPSKLSDSLEFICKTIENYVKITMTDSLIFLEPDNSPTEFKSTILSYIFSNKIAQSAIFLNHKVAESFGAGKATATILNCSYISQSYATVTNGKITEFQTFENGFVSLKNLLIQKIYDSDHKNSIIREMLDENFKESDDLILSNVLESLEKINLLRAKYKIDIFSLIKPSISKMVSVITESRFKNSMHKKNTSTSCIILSGSLFKYDLFYDFVKSCILEEIGSDFSDFVLRDKDLIYSFVGASIFGMNNYAKPMFITAHDWKSIGLESIKLKNFQS